MIEISESPLLTEDVNKKNYTNQVIQQAETLDGEKIQEAETKTETPETETPTPPEHKNETPEAKKPIIPPKTDELDKDIEDYVKSKRTFVADEDDGIKSHSSTNDNQVDDNQDTNDTETPAQTAQYDVEITPEVADLFSDIILEATKDYVPKPFTHFAKLPKKKISYFLAKHKDKINEEDRKTVLEFFEESNLKIDTRLQLTDKEAELLKRAFIEFLKQKNVQMATAGNALALQGGLIAFRLLMTSISLRTELRNDFKFMMETKFNIDMTQN